MIPKDYKISGRHLKETPREIKNRTGKIKGFLDDFMKRDKEIRQKTHSKIDNTILSKVRKIPDTKLLEKIRNSKAGKKFTLLYDLGNWQELYASQSEADIELAAILSFFTCKDYERIERIMWESGLSRPKWEQNKNYLANTIKRAIANCRNFYNPR